MLRMCNCKTKVRVLNKIHRKMFKTLKILHVFLRIVTFYIVQLQTNICVISIGLSVQGLPLCQP
jgi:1,4-dihydroxy-2-naphthoate octaprenyltransferase